jgi:hypothetical protein
MSEDTKTTIDPRRVIDIMKHCLFNDDELETSESGEQRPPKDCVFARGITNKYCFHPGRLESHRDEIRGMLECLDDNFWKSKESQGEGGGGSFLNLCHDRHGNLWTGLHSTMEALCCLAIGLELGDWLGLELFGQLPGGMPYFVAKI